MLINWIDQRFYPQFPAHWDDDIFRQVVLPHAKGRLLDLGAGAGILPQMNFRGIASEVVGVDLDPRVRSNPYLDSAIVADASRIPMGDASCDTVIANNVLEHIARPLDVFREVARVLKPGGRFIAKSPNVWHYMPLVARLTPHAFHRWFNAKRGRAQADTFATLYRANSVRAVTRLAHQSGLEVVRIELVEGRPEYMRFSAASYALGLLYERMVNATGVLAGLRVLLIAELRRVHQSTG